MHHVVSQLLSLQRVDARVATVQQKLDAIPAETERRRQGLTELQRQRDELAKSIQEAEKEVQDLESRVNSLDLALKRQGGHRDQAQNASTYAAAQHQIDYLKEDKEKLQSRQLALIEQVEQWSPTLEEHEEKLEQARREFEEYEEEAKKLEDELSRERNDIAAQREAFLGEVPPKHLTDYQNLLQTREGQAVVQVEGEYCSGCYTRITTNDMARLLGGNSIVSCTSCGRILYVP